MSPAAIPAGGELVETHVMSINGLLAADHANAENNLRAFTHFDPELPEAFDDAEHLFEAFMNSFGQGASDDDDQAAVLALCGSTGLSEQDLFAAASGDDCAPAVDQGTLDRCHAVRARFYSRCVRPLLALQAYRAYMFAATDIRRSRVCAAFGALRVEIEAVALMLLMHGDHDLAVEWYHIRDDEQGRAFFNKSKAAVQRFCKVHELIEEWNMASAASQHARLWGLVGGLTFTINSEGDHCVRECRLNFQEVDVSQPEAFICRALYLLRTQTKLLIPMQMALPEASDPLLLETRIPRFRQKVVRLYDRFEKRFPEFTARHKKVP